eukprot:290452_1
MSTDLEEELDLTKQNLWSFIRNVKATKSASLKVLQRFVLSLNKNELRHLIQCYLKYKLLQTESEDTTNDSNENSNTINPTLHTQIISKMNNNYGKKYNKKIIAKIQQKNKNKINLLSIYPQALAN